MNGFKRVKTIPLWFKTLFLRAGDRQNVRFVIPGRQEHISKLILILARWEQRSGFLYSYEEKLLLHENRWVICACIPQHYTEEGGGWFNVQRVYNEQVSK